MPMLAQFEELTPRGDRRRSPRRALRLGVSGSKAPVTVHDLSLTGALLETSVPMLVGAMFEIELPEVGPIEMMVAWNSGEFYGCEFDEPIAPAVLSAALLQSQPQGRLAEPAADPLSELQDLNAQVERIAWRMDSALKRLKKD